MQDQKEVIRRFQDLSAAFDGLRAGGERLLHLARSLVALAFRDIETVVTGGMVVPQLGAKSGKELRFDAETLQKCSASDSAECERYIERFWANASSEDGSCVLADSRHGDTCLVRLIRSDSDRPIGYFYVVVSSENVRLAKSRLEYIAKYLATAIKAEKASNALALLSDSTYMPEDTIEEISQMIVCTCREALSAKAVIVWARDRVSEVLTSIASDDVIGGVLRVDMRVGQGIAGACAERCEALVIDDLWNDDEIERAGLKIRNAELVRARGWRSALFVPLDIGGEAAGVLAAYGERPRGFSGIDLYILLTFAHRLVAYMANYRRIRELTELKRKFELEAPSIEAGMLAMENVHDSVNALTKAQNSLATLALGPMPNNRQAFQDEITYALELVRTAKSGIGVLADKAKFAEISLSRFDLKDFIQSAIAKIRLDADNVGITIQAECPRDIRVRMDQAKMHRVFFNLLQNAMWFLEHDTKGGHKNISVCVVLTPNWIEIRVRDNGPGISPYDLPHVFSYHFTTRGDRGLGFGLAIAKRIIDAHHGELSVESEWGYWTEFTVRLPSSINVGKRK